jgi:plasmid stabilization system protein ParE
VTVHWTEAALADLAAVEAYIARRSGQYARAVVDRIFAKSGLLADHPLWGRWYPNTRTSRCGRCSRTPTGSSTGSRKIESMWSRSSTRPANSHAGFDVPRLTAGPC